MEVKRAAACVALLMAVPLTGCGNATVHPLAAASPPPGGSTHASATANKGLAERESARLLSLVRLPTGATAVASVPHALRGPVMGAPSATSLVDRHRAWRLAMPLDALFRWLASHAPRGLHRTGDTESGGPSGVTMRGIEWDTTGRTTAWQSSSLVVGLAPAGPNTTVIRADGVVVWLDPTPMRDTAKGRRIHVAATATCPRNDRRVVGVTNTRRELRHQLLPTGRPTGALVCRYRGFGTHSQTLREQRRLDATQAARVAAMLRRLPLSHVDGGIYHCPMESGGAMLIAVGYPAGAVDLWAPIGRCGSIANGFIQAGAVVGYSRIAKAIG